jgi:hypothetical protein
LLVQADSPSRPNRPTKLKHVKTLAAKCLRLDATALEPLMAQGHFMAVLIMIHLGRFLRGPRAYKILGSTPEVPIVDQFEK